ncbi:hypothetical protein EYM_06685 [Ignicoccus islandicus DSM 13165]|uniref:ABC-2 type transporter transmembrane domain-containing protein n=1 Tax=Ignicoccus islandicus DSM 13165 TaxID=940295 RepID=A0A0U3F9L5_9CREN|nr:ABC transporter permease [Ignicoccus islandicus]ALU12712.1 hypothetical protein EYM_06685 [Ignicoccus islandicus DSM 13165]
MNHLKAILWKEIKDLSRDRKTLISTIVLPAFLLPMMGLLLTAAQKTVPIKVVIVNLDNGTSLPLTSPPTILNVLTNKSQQRINYGDLIASYLKKVLLNVSSSVYIEVYKSYDKVKDYDILIVIPSNFSEVLSEINPYNFKQTLVRVYFRAGPSGVNIAGSIVSQTILRTLSTLSQQVFGTQRVKVLLACCDATDVPPEAVTNPIRIVSEYVSVTGEKISAKEVSKILTAKLLLFSIFYVSMPVVAFISDSIAGERERKTLETLLASPINRRNVVIGKLAAVVVLGLLAAVADVIGLILYIQILNSQISSINVQGSVATEAFTLALDPILIAVHGIVMLLVVAATASMLMPISALSDSVRSAQSIGGFIQMIPLLVIFYAMYGSLSSLPENLKIAIYLIPHTYAVIGIDEALKGNYLGVLESVIKMIIVSTAYLAITIRIFESEYIVTGSISRKRSQAAP